MNESNSIDYYEELPVVKQRVFDFCAQRFGEREVMDNYPLKEVQDFVKRKRRLSINPHKTISSPETSDLHQFDYFI